MYEMFYYQNGRYFDHTAPHIGTLEDVTQSARVILENDGGTDEIKILDQSSGIVVATVSREN